MSMDTIARTLFAISFCSIVRWRDDEMVMAIVSIFGTEKALDDEVPAKVEVEIALL